MASHSVTVRRAEYTIYTFGKTDEPRQSTPWQRHDSLADIRQALHQARGLFASGHYVRIEVRQRAYDRRSRRMHDRTCKVFGKGRHLQFDLTSVLGFAGLCGFTAYAAALYFQW